MLWPLVGAWLEKIMAVKDIQKYRWPEHGQSIPLSGRAIWKRILLRSREHKNCKKND